MVKEIVDVVEEEETEDESTKNSINDSGESEGEGWEPDSKKNKVI